MGLENAAIRLGQNKVIMNSYWLFHKRQQNWFFSPNSRLAGATRKPNQFNSWKHWDSLLSTQKSTLATLAGFHYTASNVIRNNNHLTRLKKAYSSWDSSLFSVFWSNTGYSKIWLCNVFVGDAIYMYNRKNFTGANRHYYDPRQILNGHSFLKKRSSYEEVEAGDIVVFGDYHVEIITSLVNHFFADDGFCSIGAGRGNIDQGIGNGEIKCDSFFASATRELDNDNNTYFYL